MKTDLTQDNPAEAARTIGAIDIGSNALRMVVAEVMPDGQVKVLEELRRAIRLGQDTFCRARISGRTMRSAVAILRDYRRVLDVYKVERVRAVATSAVREAGNADTFIDRVYMATGLDVIVIDTSEESRLTVSAVRREMGDARWLGRKRALVVEVGGGGTLLTVLQGGEIVASEGLRLGSIRLQEALSMNQEPPERTARVLSRQIAHLLAAVKGPLAISKIQVLVVVGGDARFAAEQVGRTLPSIGLPVVNQADLDKLVRRCQRYRPEDLAKAYRLPFADAETLTPALLVYQALLHTARTKQMIVSNVSMRDGLILDLANVVTGREDESLSRGVLRAALAVAEKYQTDLDHARCVAELALRLFDELQDVHGLGPRHRLLLNVAGLLHEIGTFVSSRAHHKHSYYLVANSEVFGLTRNELLITALACRYHRRSSPKPSHVEYTSLQRETRMVVSKLAALLRVADALEAGHAQQVRDIQCERRDEEFIIHVPGATDLTLERKSLSAKGDLFEEVYGMRVRVEEAPLAAAKP